jgi:hypothetical protein
VWLQPAGGELYFSPMRQILHGGIANLGVFLQESAGAKAVAKRTANKREIAFVKDFSEQFSDIAPKVISFAENDEYVEYVSEFVPLSAIARTEENAERIGLAIASLCRLSAPTAVVFSLKSRNHETINRPDIAGTIEALRSNLLDHPKCYWHGDITERHISLVGQSVKFIDWGQFGINLVGADLNHFLFEAIAERQRQGFFEQLLQSYTRHIRKYHHNLSQEQVLTAATLTTLYRALSRFKLKGRPQDLEKLNLVQQHVRDNWK